MTAPFHGQWGHPAVFGDTTTLTASNAGAANDYLYYIGKNDILRVLKFGVNGLGRADADRRGQQQPDVRLRRPGRRR